MAEKRCDHVFGVYSVVDGEGVGLARLSIMDKTGLDLIWDFKHCPYCGDKLKLKRKKP